MPAPSLSSSSTRAPRGGVRDCPVGPDRVHLLQYSAPQRFFNRTDTACACDMHAHHPPWVHRLLQRPLCPGVLRWYGSGGVDGALRDGAEGVVIVVLGWRARHVMVSLEVRGVCTQDCYGFLGCKPVVRDIVLFIPVALYSWNAGSFSTCISLTLLSPCYGEPVI